MKNCLIVLVVLIGCAAIAGWLALHPDLVYGSGAQGRPYMIAKWTDYSDDDLWGLDVDVGTDQMLIDVPAFPQARRITVTGHWNLHAFYIDSHVDSPAEIKVARELKNEDLEVDIGRFLPEHPGKIVCVKTFRISDPRPPYPVMDPNVTVTYPPPKGLIRVGMLQCDLDTLPWHSDVVEIESGQRPGRAQPELYTFRSDRPGVPKLLVTVYLGRVIEVVGGAEETADIPYQLPAPAPPAELTPAVADRSWGEWLFDWFFAK